MGGACSKPFVLVTEEDMSELIENSDPANTKKQIKYAVSRTNSFASCAGVTCLDNMTDLELDNFLARFYAGLRKDDGHLYSTKSMHGLRYRIRKHFQSLKGIDITNNEQFVQSNRVLICTYHRLETKLRDKVGKYPVAWGKCYNQSPLV
jgi:hypothetical protein